MTRHARIGPRRAQLLTLLILGAIGATLAAPAIGYPVAPVVPTLKWHRCPSHSDFDCASAKVPLEAIYCSESPNPPPSSFAEQAAFADARSGPVGQYWTWLGEPCSTWPARAAERYAGPWNKRTHTTILLVNTTVDPATPYSGALAMSRQLARTRLLTLDGYGHTSLLNPSACVNSYESRYFISGVLPPRGARCRQDHQPF